MELDCLKDWSQIAKWAIGSQYNKVDPMVATAIVFVYRIRRIYSKAFQGKSNTLILGYDTVDRQVRTRQ